MNFFKSAVLIILVSQVLVLSLEQVAGKIDKKALYFPLAPKEQVHISERLSHNQCIACTDSNMHFTIGSSTC